MVKKSVFGGGLITALLVISLISLTSATGIVKQITCAVDSSVSVNLNGERFILIDPKSKKELKPINYQNNYYLPVNAIGEAFGVNAYVNEKSKTIVLGAQAGNSTSTSKAKPLKIKSMKAYLHYFTDGTFSKNIIDDPEANLFNVFLESDAMRVDVEILGDHNGQDFSRQLQLIVKGADGQTIYSKVTDLFIPYEGKCIYSYYVYDLGTEAVQIRAKILGQKEVVQVEKTVEFYGGE